MTAFLEILVDMINPKRELLSSFLLKTSTPKDLDWNKFPSISARAKLILFVNLYLEASIILKNIPYLGHYYVFPALRSSSLENFFTVFWRISGHKTKFFYSFKFVRLICSFSCHCGLIISDKFKKGQSTFWPFTIVDNFANIRSLLPGFIIHGKTGF